MVFILAAHSTHCWLVVVTHTHKVETHTHTLLLYCSCYTVSQATRQTVDGLACTNRWDNEHVCVCVCLLRVLLFLILLLSLLLILLLILLLLSMVLLLSLLAPIHPLFAPLLAPPTPLPLVFCFCSFLFQDCSWTNTAVLVRCCMVSATSDRSHDNAQATATWTMHPLGEHVG